MTLCLCAAAGPCAPPLAPARRRRPLCVTVRRYRRCARSAQHELTGVAGVGLRVLRQVTADTAAWRLARLGNGGRRQDRERERDRCTDENRQSHEYSVEELRVDHVKPRIKIVFTPFI